MNGNFQSWEEKNKGTIRLMGYIHLQDPYWTRTDIGKLVKANGKKNSYLDATLLIPSFVVVVVAISWAAPTAMEVPRLGVESELQPPAYARATATRDPSRVCNLHHSSRQSRIVITH